MRRSSGPWSLSSFLTMMTQDIRKNLNARSSQFCLRFKFEMLNLVRSLAVKNTFEILSLAVSCLVQIYFQTIGKTEKIGVLIHFGGSICMFDVYLGCLLHSVLWKGYSSLLPVTLMS